MELSRQSLINKMRLYKPHHFVGILFKISKGKAQRNILPVKELFKYTYRTLFDFTAAELCSIIYLLTKLKIDIPGTWIDRWFEASIEVSYYRREIYLIYNLHTLVDINIKIPAWWFDKWFDKCLRYTKCFDVKAIFNTIGYLSKLNIKIPSRWLDEWFNVSINHMRGLSMSKLKTTLCLLADLSIDVPDSWICYWLRTYLCKELNDLYDVVGALRRLNFNIYPTCTDFWMTSLIVNVKLTGLDLLEAIIKINNLNVSVPSDIVEYCYNETYNHMDDYNQQELYLSMMALFGLNRGNSIDHRWLTKWFDASISKLNEFKSKWFADVIDVLIACGYKPANIRSDWIDNWFQESTIIFDNNVIIDESLLEKVDRISYQLPMNWMAKWFNSTKGNLKEQPYINSIYICLKHNIRIPTEWLDEWFKQSIKFMPRFTIFTLQFIVQIADRQQYNIQRLWFELWLDSAFVYFQNLEYQDAYNMMSFLYQLNIPIPEQWIDACIRKMIKF